MPRIYDWDVVNFNKSLEENINLQIFQRNLKKYLKETPKSPYKNKHNTTNITFGLTTSHNSVGDIQDFINVGTRKLVSLPNGETIHYFENEHETVKETKKNVSCIHRINMKPRQLPQFDGIKVESYKTVNDQEKNGCDQTVSVEVMGGCKKWRVLGEQITPELGIKICVMRPLC